MCKSFFSYFPHAATTKKYQIYLHQTSDKRLQLFKTCTFRCPMKITSQGGAIVVPIAVPINCLRKRQVMFKDAFFLNTHSAKSFRQSVDILL